MGSPGYVPLKLRSALREGVWGGVWGRGTDLVVQHEEQCAADAQVPWPLHLEPICLLGGGCPVPLPRGGDLGHLIGPSWLLGPRALRWSLLQIRVVEGTVVCGRVAVARAEVGSYLNEVVVGAIKVFVQLNDQTLEEGRELPLLLAGLWERDRDRGGRTGTMGAGRAGAGWGWSGRAAWLEADLCIRTVSSGRPPLARADSLTRGASISFCPQLSPIPTPGHLERPGPGRTSSRSFPSTRSSQEAMLPSESSASGFAGLKVLEI